MTAKRWAIPVIHDPVVLRPSFTQVSERGSAAAQGTRQGRRVRDTWKRRLTWGRGQRSESTSKGRIPDLLRDATRAAERIHAISVVAAADGACMAGGVLETDLIRNPQLSDVDHHCGESTAPVAADCDVIGHYNNNRRDGGRRRYLRRRGVSQSRRRFSP
jgi:hypothetical protein